MKNKADICVLIPHYNGLEELYASIKSIAEEIPVDVLVVDDGSVIAPDETHLKSLYRLGKLDLIVLPENKGIEVALNTGLLKITSQNYKYIGRLDCGDINHFNKYKKQLAYFKQNPDVKLLGTWVRILDNSKKYLYDVKHPVMFKNIKRKMKLNSTFIHPTVVFKAEIIGEIGLYPTDYPAAEDYAFFFKIIEHYKAENLPEVLLDYINDPNSISATKRKVQVKSRIKIQLKHFTWGLLSVYGILRSFMLYLIPRNFMTFLKKQLYA